MPLAAHEARLFQRAGVRLGCSASHREHLGFRGRLKVFTDEKKTVGYPHRPLYAIQASLAVREYFCAEHSMVLT